MKDPLRATKNNKGVIGGHWMSDWLWLFTKSLVYCETNPNKGGVSGLTNLVCIKCYKNKMKVIESQSPTNFERTYVGSP